MLTRFAALLSCTAAAAAVGRGVAAGSAAAARPAAGADDGASTCPAQGCHVSEPPVLLQRGRAKWSWWNPFKSHKPEGNVYERVRGVGSYGGSCTCPDGQSYNVGDRMDGCAQGSASLACIGGVPGQCIRQEEKAREGMQVTCAPSAAPPASPPAAPEQTTATATTTQPAGGEAERSEIPGDAAQGRCRAPASWPSLKDGVTCESCTALVLTAPFGGRCDRYCESFGHTCVSAAEEVSDNCDVLYQKSCAEAITGTSDMLCSCQQTQEVPTAPPTAPPPPAPTEAPAPVPVPAACAATGTWPNLKDGVTCGSCAALVLTAPYGGRCDRYCESFGHTCVSAAEEVSDNCDVLYRKGCEEPITGTSDMLCTCARPDGGAGAGQQPPTGSPTAPPTRAPRTTEQPSTTEPPTDAPGAGPTCASPTTWPSLKNGVTCGSCAALVLTAPYGGRCDRYCESFGHACEGAAEEVADNCDVLETKACSEPIEGTSDMLCTCRQQVSADQGRPAPPAVPAPPPEEPRPTPAPAPQQPSDPQPQTCASPRSWPDLKGGVTCEACTALVRTGPHGGRCDVYCESFGHRCVAAAEEVADNCAVLYQKRCDESITGTSDMLCTCQKAAGGATVPAPSAAASGDETFRASGRKVGGRDWCATKKPASNWALFKTCGGEVPVNVLSYNLYWWNLYDRRGGNDRSAGKLIERNGPFDLMGFQECDSIGRILSDARLDGSHVGLQGPSALAIAYAKDAWELLDQGKGEVGEDRPEQHYGRRRVQWVRLRHRVSGKTVFFMNHHGPLPVNTGGICGGEATASHILQLLGENSRAGDLRVLVGDFNADGSSDTQALLNRHMRRVNDHWVDAIYSSCPAQNTRNLGKGGSDHDAISATIGM